MTRRPYARQDLALLQGRSCLPKIKGGLLCKPHLSRATAVTPEPTLNAQRHRRADRGSAVQHLREGGAVHAQLSSSLAHRQAKRRQDIVPQGQAGMGGLCISLMGTSVVILVINQFCVAVFECEGQSPVSADTDAPVVGQFSLEGMQSPAGDVHVRPRFGPTVSDSLTRMPLGARSLRRSIS